MADLEKAQLGAAMIGLEDEAARLLRVIEEVRDLRDRFACASVARLLQRMSLRGVRGARVVLPSGVVQAGEDVGQHHDLHSSPDESK